MCVCVCVCVCVCMCVCVCVCVCGKRFTEIFRQVNYACCNKIFLSNIIVSNIFQILYAVREAKF